MSAALSVLAAAESTLGAHAEEVVLRLLYQLIAILLVTRVVVWLARRVGQTDVSGEILAGLVLGPSLLGAFAPDLMAGLFHPSTSTVFIGLAQVGLVFLMFQIGLEFEFRATLGSAKRGVALISFVGIAVPFALGYFTAPWFWHQLPEPRPLALGFQLFFAVAMSITAIPILGRIFMELGLSHTRTAAITIGAAAVDDVIGWLLLGVISLVVAGRFEPIRLAGRVGALLAYVALVFLVARPILKKVLRAQLARDGRLRHATIAGLLVVVFVSAAITSNLGVFAIIGGFCIGVALHDDRRLVAEWKTRVAPLVNTFFLPIFFAYTGLRTDVGSIDSWREGGIFLLVCAVAFAGKMGGAYVGARVIGESNRSALTIATCMNTRALMELVALNIGYDLGVLPKSMFTKLVLMAIASTYMATPIIRRLMRGQERPVDQPREAVGLHLELADGADWGGIERARLGVRELVTEALGDGDRGAAVSTVVAELLENAVRRAHDQGPPPVLDLAVDGAHIEVRVTSAAPPEAAALALLQEQVRWVNSFADPREAFLEATRRLYEGGAVDGLGLARVAYEGGCRLGVSTSGARVTLHAMVPIQEPAAAQPGAPGA